MSREAVRGCATLFRGALDTGGRQVEVSTVGSANAASNARIGLIDTEPQDPSAGREQRHVHVIENENLVAKRCEPVEVFRTFVMRDSEFVRIKF